MRGKLTFRQRGQVVLALLVMYFPVFMYLDFPVYRPDLSYDGEIFLYQLITLFIVAFTLLLWIYCCEVFLDFVLRRFGESILMPLNVPRAMTMVLLTTILAVAFIVLMREIMHTLEYTSVALFGKGFRTPYPVDESPAYWDLYKRSNFGFFLLLMLSTFFLIAYDRSVRYVKEMEFKAGQLEKKKIEAELKALRDQISPHFLFNSLSILDAIVKDNPELSRRFIRELSGSYRYLLEQERHSTVAIGRELEFIQSYIFLLKMRFNEKLNISIDVPGDHNERYRIPPMTLQMLVENAVRHNKMTAEHPLKVNIATTPSGITVSNNLNRRRDAGSSTGIGLQNIISRYSMLTSAPVRIEQLNNQFTVSLPTIE